MDKVLDGWECSDTEKCSAHSIRDISVSIAIKGGTDVNMVVAERIINGSCIYKLLQKTFELRQILADRSSSFLWWRSAQETEFIGCQSWEVQKCSCWGGIAMNFFLVEREKRNMEYGAVWSVGTCMYGCA